MRRGRRRGEAGWRCVSEDMSDGESSRRMLEEGSWKVAFSCAIICALWFTWRCLTRETLRKEIVWQMKGCVEVERAS